MSLPQRRIAALAAEGGVIAMSSIVVLIGVTSGAYVDLPPLSAATLFIGLSLYFGLGVVLVLRVDGHRVGWLFAHGSTALAATFACWSLASIIGEMDAEILQSSWFYFGGAVLLAPAVIMTLPAVAMVFPTGGLPSPRWRWPVALVVGLLVIETVALFLTMVVFNAPEDESPPAWIGLMEGLGPILEIALGVGSLAIPTAAILGIAAIVVRFRRSRGEQRQQLKWFVVAFIPAAMLLPLSLSDTVLAAFPLVSLASELTLPLAAVAVAIAITRYRLYEIDRIVSRTIAYAVVTAVLFATFFAVNVALQRALGDVLGDSPVVVAASTLVVAALFQPLRGRVQHVVDRRFHRAHYDAERTVAGFSGRLRDQLDLPTLTAELRRATADTVEPCVTTVWLRATGPR